MIARRILFILIACVAALLVTSQVNAQSETEPVDNFQLQAFLTEEQALAIVFPECDEIVADNLVMTPEEKAILKPCLAEDSAKMGLWFM